MSERERERKKEMKNISERFLHAAMLQRYFLVVVAIILVLVSNLICDLVCILGRYIRARACGYRFIYVYVCVCLCDCWYWETIVVKTTTTTTTTTTVTASTRIKQTKLICQEKFTLLSSRASESESKRASERERVLAFSLSLSLVVINTHETLSNNTTTINNITNNKN